ncbi:MAG: DUF3450 family protein [Spongiibacteraceae bacterium]|jgi:hypothetical protein
MPTAQQIIKKQPAKTFCTPHRAINSLLLFLLSTASISSAQQSLPAQLDRLCLQWQQTEQQRSQLESQWLKRQAILEQQLELLDIEQAAMHKTLNNDQQRTGDVEQKRSALLQQQINAEQNQQTLESNLASYFKNILELQHRLPPPLQQQWQNTLDNVNNNFDGGNHTNDNNQQLEQVLQLLAQLENFENRIALNQTIMTIDNTEIQVQQFYLGLSQGWYIDNSGQYAGYGISTAQGWQWHNKDGIAGLNTDELLKVVAILNNQSMADFVELPVDLRGSLSDDLLPPEQRHKNHSPAEVAP